MQCDFVCGSNENYRKITQYARIGLVDVFLFKEPNGKRTEYQNRLHLFFGEQNLILKPNHTRIYAVCGAN